MWNLEFFYTFKYFSLSFLTIFTYHLTYNVFEQVFGTSQGHEFAPSSVSTPQLPRDLMGQRICIRASSFLLSSYKQLIWKWCPSSLCLKAWLFSCFSSWLIENFGASYFKFFIFVTAPSAFQVSGLAAARSFRSSKISSIFLSETNSFARCFKNVWIFFILLSLCAVVITDFNWLLDVLLISFWLRRVVNLLYFNGI